MPDGKGTPRTPIAILRLGKHRIPMTPDEAAALEGRLRAWIDARGIPYGFVRALLAGDA
ncbi:hypothetical protein [Roseospira goensis]|uniref:Uncharacterized protein n=1 Tax=Roseospira goensis TaxID=391922 RepID=A0A7W6S2V2_9PROT|nr:hypothetical protein [Roseospira goensis]MBB4287824.1 hypothetical protein [Roseospira goensis]